MSRPGSNGCSRSKIAPPMASPADARTNTGVSGCSRATRPASCTPLPGGPSAMMTAVSRACAWSIASSVRSRWSRQRTGCATTAGSDPSIAAGADARYSRRMSGDRRSSSATRSSDSGAGGSSGGGWPGSSARPAAAAFTSSACSQARRASSSRMASVRVLSPHTSRCLGWVRSTRETRPRAVDSAELSASSNQPPGVPLCEPRQWSACLGSSMSATRCGWRSGSGWIATAESGPSRRSPPRCPRPCPAARRGS